MNAPHFISFKDDAELISALHDAAEGRGLAPDFALPLAVGLIDRLLGRIARLEQVVASAGPSLAAE